MQKTLYLHIGTEKTGSTALQAVSGINRAALMNHGILYPKTPGKGNHIKLTLFAADGPRVRDLRKLAQLVPDSAYELFQARFADELRSEIVASECARIYLSNEHLSSRLKSAQEVGRLASIVRPLAETVKIVVYVRPQAELFLSTYSTSIKNGRIKAMEPPKRKQDPRYNYEKKLSLWADVFGENNLIVRIYDRDTLIGRDVITDFFSIMDYEPGPDIEIPANANVRLDHDALRFLLEFNKYVPPYLEQNVNPDRGDISNALSMKAKGPALAIPASVLRDITKTYEESNARVARRFLGRSDGRLFPDVEIKDRPEEAALTAERAVEISAHLWCWQQRELANAKRKIAALKAKLASIGMLG